MLSTFSKSLLLSCVAVVSVQAVNISPRAPQTVFLPKNASLADVQSSSKIMAWDLHHVVLNSDRGARIKGGIKKSPQLIGGLIKAIFKKSHRTAISEARKLAKQASGDSYIEIFEKHNAKDLAAFVQVIRNGYKPAPQVVDIIKNLNAAKIEQIVASNIGPRAIAEFNDVLKTKKMDNVFDILNKGLLVKYAATADTTVTVDGNVYNLTSDAKPNAAYFAQLHKLYAQSGSHIVFIDDNLENVQAAAQNGCVGIWFRHKNKDAAQELRTNLHTLGLTNV